MLRLSVSVGEGHQILFPDTLKGRRVGALTPQLTGGKKWGSGGSRGNPHRPRLPPVLSGSKAEVWTLRSQAVTQTKVSRHHHFRQGLAYPKLASNSL